MSRDWKPGDVAELEVMDECVRAVVGADECWLIFGHTYFKSIRVDNKTLVRNARPLVVIDPEDREAVEVLRKVLSDSGAFTGLTKGNVSKIQQALREFADPKPPKPDEPTGLGAVVEDAEGDLWVRCDAEDHGSWRRANDDALWRDYLSIDAVRVLSEGIDA